MKIPVSFLAVILMSSCIMLNGWTGFEEKEPDIVGMEGDKND